MFYVGADIHSKQITVCVLNSDGQVHLRRQVRRIDQMTDLLESLPGKCSVCFEASCGYGRYYELFEPLADRVVVAHPGKLQAIYRSSHKNDRHDAKVMATLLMLDSVPVVHVPHADVRAWRETITFRVRLVEKRTRVKNSLRALLRSLGIVVPKRPGLWSQAGCAWLKSLQFVQPMHDLKRDILLEELETLNRQIRQVEKVLEKYSDNNMSVKLLRSIPGVGPRTAEAVVAFLDNPKRFKHSKAVGSYFGLVPKQDQSGDKNRLGHITREGPAIVRKLLVEATWQAVRLSPTIKAYQERIMRDDPKRKCISVVATAHYLVRVMWSMLKHQSRWRESVSEPDKS